jgi:integrase
LDNLFVLSSPLGREESHEIFVDRAQPSSSLRSAALRGLVFNPFSEGASTQSASALLTAAQQIASTVAVTRVYQRALDFLPHLDPPVRMANLSPTTLTATEQALILRATAANVRDHVIISLALGTGVRLGEFVGLDVGEGYGPDGVVKVRVRVRKEIAKGGRAADVFLPDRLGVKLRPKLQCHLALETRIPRAVNRAAARELSTRKMRGRAAVIAL